MKTILSLLTLTVALSVAGSARAGEASGQLEVRLNVEESCSVAAEPVEIALGGETGVTGTSTIATTCSPNTTYALAIDAGGDTVGLAAPVTRNDGSVTLAYAVSGERTERTWVRAKAGMQLAAYSPRAGGTRRSIPERAAQTVVVAVNF